MWPNDRVAIAFLSTPPSTASTLPADRSAARAARDERPRELVLPAHDLTPVPPQRENVAPGAQLLPLEKKPPEEILEGFDGERFLPARGGCGLRRG
jgi:hypothetical protein